MSDPVIYWPRVKIYTRVSLTEGEWAETPTLDCMMIVERASPGVSEATFVCRSGTVLFPGETAFADREPAELVGKYVRVDLLDPKTPDDPDPDDEPRRMFVFIFRSDRRTIGADLSDSIAQPVQQTLAAVGLESELDRIAITGGVIYDRALTASDEESNGVVRIRSPLEFNEVGRVGLSIVGNRNGDKVSFPEADEVSWIGERTAYAFEALPRLDGTQSDPWSVFDIVEYLNLAFVKGIPLQWSYEAADTEEPIPLAAALALIKPASFAAEGMSVRQAFDALLRPERGISWCIRPVPDQFDLEGPAKLEIFAYPINDVDLTLTDATLPANINTVDLDPATDPAIASCEVGLEQSEAYGKVIVLGERLLSCFTLAVDDFAGGKLVKDWTEQEEADYTRLTNNLARSPEDVVVDVQDAFTGLDDLQHVFCRYRLADGWNGFASVSKGVESANVNPKLLTDGEIDDDASAGFYRRGVGFEDRLPIPAPDRPGDDGYLRAGAMYFLDAFAVVQVPPPEGESGRRHAMLHTVPSADAYTAYRGDTHMMPTRLAVQVHLAEPHVMANSANWTEPDTSVVENNPTPSVYAWEEVKATLALRTGERLFAERTIPDAVSERELVIEVPGAELWIVDPATIVGVCGGQPITYGNTAPRKIRDDSARVKDVAVAAAAWYGKVHRALNLVSRRPRSYLPLGTFVNSVALTDETPVNLCLSEIVWDFVGRTQTISAGAAAPAFGNLAAGAAPNFPTR